MNAYATTDRPAVGEFNGLVNGIAYHNDRHSQDDGVDQVDWTEPGLVTRCMKRKHWASLSLPKSMMVQKMGKAALLDFANSRGLAVLPVRRGS